jgi:hypothetical protein
MFSQTAEYLAVLRYGDTQLATLRSLGEHRGKQQLFVIPSPEELLPTASKN